MQKKLLSCTKLIFYKLNQRSFTMANNNYQDTLAKLNLDEKAIKEISKNISLCESIHKIVDDMQIENLDKKQGNILYTFMTKSAYLPSDSIKEVSKYIIQDQIKTKVQVDEAIKYIKENNPVDFKNKDVRTEFENLTGIGKEYTEKEINEYIENFITANEKEVSKKPNHPGNLAKLRDGLKFADQKLLISNYNKITKERFGDAKAVNETKVVDDKKNENDEKDLEELEQEKIKKYRTEKLVARDMMEGLNSAELIKKHKEETGGSVITRFPPEPNGYLHIGHCKAMRFNFKIAADYGGYTNLRYDDTNPEAESLEYVEKIKENVEWMGYKPKHIVHASDYFDKIYNAAIQLIKVGKAFVCKLSKEEAKQYRESNQPSPFRDTTPEQNLAEFELMTAGYYKEGEASLRAKIDYQSNNPNLRDPVIYRIRYTPHPHIGNKWCVYPLYDFVHSLSDSIENITHSLCTLEFENRRELYYWTLKQLDWYRPYVWEYSRLNLTANVLSKRKLLKLVNEKYVSGWDDPRLLTIEGMKRRGYPPQAINDFCDLISVTRRGNDNVLSFELLEYSIRNYLKNNSKNAFGILDPVPVDIDNITTSQEINLETFGYKCTLGNLVYVDSDDVRPKDIPNYYGIAPGKIVRLRYGPFIKINSVNQDSNGKFNVKASLIEEKDIENYKKIKGVLHWISKQDAVPCEIRVYDKLFLTDFPGEKTGNFIDDLNPASKKVYSNGFINKKMIESANINDRWQFERKGYYGFDKDTDLDAKKYVFNQIVSLKAKAKLKSLLN